VFDTIRVGFNEVDLDPEKLMRKGWVRAEYEQRDAEGVPKLTDGYSLRREKLSPHFLSWSPGNGRLKLETSFPKMLYGNNVMLIQPGDVERGLHRLSEIVSDVTGQAVDAWESGEVQGRVDFVFAYDTSWDGRGHVGDYLDAFKSLELPRHYTQNVAKDATLYWRNGARVIRMYDKFRESREAQAKNILRFEVQENHTKAVMERLGHLGSMRVSEVARWDVAKRVLGGYLEGMGADLVVSNERELARRLVKEVGPARARRLMGYIVYLRLYGRQGMEGLGFERTMPWRDKREIERVGMAAAVNDRDGGACLLPPLGLPEIYTGEALRLKA